MQNCARMLYSWEIKLNTELHSTSSFDLNRKSPRSTTIFYGTASVLEMHVHQILFFPLPVFVLYFLSPYSSIFSVPPFYPFLLSFAPRQFTSTLLISHPLYSPSQCLSSTCLHLPTLFLCICPLTLCLSFHTSVYTPHSPRPFASLPAPRICVALHGQRAPRLISSQSPGNTKKLPDTYTGRAGGGQEDRLITVSKRESGEERSKKFTEIFF